VNILALLDLGQPLLGTLRLGASILRRGLAVSNDALRRGEQALVFLRVLCIQVLKGRPEALFRLSVLFLQLALLVRHGHRDPSMNLPDQLAQIVVAEPVGYLVETRMKLGPERHPVNNVSRPWYRAQHGDVLVTHFAFDAARLDQAALQPAACLSEANEHV